jgi:PKD repeat protein
MFLFFTNHIEKIKVMNSNLFFVFFFLLIIITSSCKLREPLDPCLKDFVPDFEISYIDSIVPVKVAFTNKTKNISASTTFKWILDSTNTSSAKDTQFTYNKQGIYKVRLIVSNCSGETLSIEKTINTKVLTYYKPIDGNQKDIGTRIKKTNDGHFVVCGISRDSKYIWAGKFDRFGNFFWKKDFPELGEGEARDIIETRDGNFMICGSVRLNSTNTDIIVAKLSGSNGQLEQPPYKTFGGESNELALSIKETLDGGFIVAGLNSSTGGRIRSTTNALGGYDMYLLKLNANRSPEWDSKFGGTGYDAAASVIQLSDQSYLLCGTTSSMGKGSNDVFIVKTNSTGQIIGNPKLYGDTEEDVAFSMKPTEDGNFIISGFSASIKEKTKGGKDFFVLKIESDGGLLWKETYGTPNEEVSFDVTETNDKGFAAIGYQEGNNLLGLPQVYWVKIDADGKELNKKTLGLLRYGRGGSLVETFDCGLMIFGTSFINNTKDFLIIKTDENGNFD